MNIGLLGFGVVGGGVLELTQSRSDIAVSRVLLRSPKVGLPEGLATYDFNDILTDDAIDTVVEVMGGLHPAYEYVSAAMERGKNVVTANKALIAAYYPELTALAKEKGVALRCTAAVGGGIPWLGNLARVKRLDPVGAGASQLRTDTANRLLREVKFTVIRGNISEIKTLASGAGTTKGVDADMADKVTEENLDSAVAFAKAFAARTGAVVAITGAIDIVADAHKAYCIRNGHPMMSSITGTGCQLSALTAAFVTANPGQPLEAAAAAVCAMGLAGEIAHSRLSPLDGNSTYRNYIIDAVYNMTPAQLEEGATYEVR